MKKLFLVMALSLVVTTGLKAQIADNLERFSEQNGKGYIQPLVNGLAVSMNRGWYQNGDIPVLGLRLRLTVSAMIAPVPDDDRTFTATTEGVFSPTQTAEAPTIVGSENSTSVGGSGGTLYTFPGGLNLSATGFAVPQLTIGSFLGTEVTIRYLVVELGDTEMGDLKIQGYGLRHSISQYIPLFPIDVSFGVFYQNIDVGDELLKFTALHYGVQASRGFGPLLIYGGAGFDNSTANIKYLFDDGVNTTTLEYELKGDDGIEITAGLGLNLFLIRFHGDVTFGIRTVFTAGVSIGL